MTDTGSQGNGFEKGSDLGLEHSNVEIVHIQSDEDFNKKFKDFETSNLGRLNERDEKYTEILNLYYKYISTILDKNISRQKWFFWLSIIILVASPIQFVVFLWLKSESMVAIVASVTEVIGALLTFPKIIAEYLFNTNESTNVNDVVTTIQNYDIEVRNGVRHTAENTLKEKQ